MGELVVVRVITLVILLCCSGWGNGFILRTEHVSRNNKPLYVFNMNPMARKGITLPILDFSDSDMKVVTPLPSSHLPEELTTLNLYGMELSRPIHKMLMEEASSTSQINGSFGHIIQKKDSSSLVGAIGCSGDVFIQAAKNTVDDTTNNSEIGKDAPIMVLYKGCYRFIIREVIKTIPYPVALVDEIFDDDISNENNNIVDEEDDLYYYSQVSSRELKERIMGAVRTYLKFELESSTNQEPEAPPSLLEQSILESSGISAATANNNKNNKQLVIEESAAIFDVFSSSLIDFATTPKEQNFAIAMIAAEIISVGEEIRREMVTMTDSVRRLQLICKTAEEHVSLLNTRKVVTEITTDEEEQQKELTVGTPQLPPWAYQISKGTRIEYYWNEEWEWSPGEVVEDPLKIMDELLLTIRFDDQGEEIHRLPLNPDEKLRWRPEGFGEKKEKKEE